MRLIRSVRRSVSNAVSLSLVTALVLSRIDYGNATLAGLPARQLCRLQSVLHAAARIIFSARKFDHVTPLLWELHWFRVPERITFKLASLVFRCLNGAAPLYLADSINRTDVVETRRSLRLRSSSLTAVDVQWHVAARLGIALFQSLLPALGTAYRRLPRQRRHCRLSSDIWRRTCSLCRTECSDLCSSSACFSLSTEHVVFSFFLACYVTCPCSFWTKRHVNLFVNNNNNNNNILDTVFSWPYLVPYGAYATGLRLSSVTWSIVAKRCVLEQKLLLTAYRKSYMRNRLVPK